jgi:hypothetical protein
MRRFNEHYRLIFEFSLFSCASNSLFHMNNIQRLGHGLGFEKMASGDRAGQRWAWPSVMARLADDCLLAAIPPERVGLDGEYDHFGLVKRVQLALRQELGEESVAQLAIAQRGKVVIFRGQALDARFVRQITRLTLAIEGTDSVEIFDGETLTPLAA